MSTVSNQILVSKTIPQKKEPGLLGEIGDSRIGAGNTQMSLENSVVPGNEEVLKQKCNV